MLTGARELREDQAAAVAALRAKVGEGRRRLMVQAPTAFGKTVVAGAIARAAVAKDRRVLVTVPALSLVDQTVESLAVDGVRDVGVIQGMHELTNWDKPVQVATVQTLMRRTMPRAHVAIVDEAHKWFAFYGKWFRDPDWQDVPIIGLSATPWTRGLGLYYEELVVAGTTRELIERGHLSPFKVYAPTHPDLHDVKVVAGDYHEGELACVMSRDKIVADVVKTWLERAEGRPTLCFAVDRAHAKYLRDKFESHGVPCGYIDAHTSRQDREQARLRLATGAYRVVCNVGCLTTGVDWDVRCISLVRPTRSEILFVQIVGRGLRTAEGKDHCLVLDHSDTHLRLGFVTDIHHERLSRGAEPHGRNERPIALPRECPQCHYLKAARQVVCPSCGFAVALPPARPLLEAEGELGEMTASQKRSKKRRAREVFDQEEAMGMLKYVASERGYKPGWAYHKYKELFGVGPNGHARAEPMRPSMAMRSWLRSRQIAWVNSRENPANKRGEEHA